MEPTLIVFQTRGLCFSYPDRPLFNDLSVCLKAGVSLVLGGDGAGKTTLLRLWAGDLAAQQGQLLLAGIDHACDPDSYQRHVFWQDPRSSHLDALDAHTWWQTLPSAYPGWDSAALHAHTEGLGLAAHIHKPLYQLSTGSKRKVLMAAALASGAALTLIDEPVAGLDQPSVRYLQQALQAAASTAARAIVVAHYEALANVPWRDIISLAD